MLDRTYPTPYVSSEVRRRKFAVGVMITASHNPPTFNGCTVKAHLDGSATPLITAQIEKNLGAEPKVNTFSGELVAPEPHYVHHLKSLVDWDRISKSKLKIVVDSMHGCGGYILEELLR